MFIQDSEQKDYINVKGCVPQFEKWLQDNLTLVAGIFIGVALLQVSSLPMLNLHGAPQKLETHISFMKKCNVANLCFLFLSSTDFWYLFGPELSE